ncbi:aromatic ring-hydroxylating oxygenase subunit alpha [Kiloniella sp. b19]|uniref:aromatic ring-hydroxylating oxygenase subunit alpha n=1 Tax=Kiloniella sp. GXU_MW_B19 TaxID=3141326 RepID=UPI0031D14466
MNSSRENGFQGLPVEAYTSREWFDQEQIAVFGKSWHLAGLAEDVTEKGSFLTVQAGNYPMIVLHGHDGRLRAFHNFCRHRGTRLLRGAGKAGKAITCPYHDWTYRCDGTLLSVPNEAEDFPDLDRACLHLKAGSVGFWRGMLFVHPQEDAIPLRDWFGGLEPYLAPYSPEKLVEYPGTQVEYSIRANWKIVAENYIDAYHLAHLHSGTLRMYDHKRIESRFVRDHFVFWQPCSEAYLKNLEINAPYPLIDHSPQEKLGAYVPLLFPGIGLVESEVSWSVFHMQPVAPDETRVVVRSRFAKASGWRFARQYRQSTAFWEQFVRPKYANLDEDDPMGSADFMAEDIYVCEQQQQSFSSPEFEQGPSALVGEKAVREHQELILKKMAEFLS